MLGLAACTSSLPNYEARVHVVKPGETLYTIAWRYGLDYRALAQWNRLSDPDLIYAGQRLRLTPPAASTVTARSGPAPRHAPSGRPAPSAAPRGPPPSPAPAPAWQWPTRGEVVTQFGSSADIASGIGISGRLGQPVDAAAAGRVVYAGSGLIGYGQLIIIKHNDTYLSAYGHNRRLLVHQGEQVRRGQQIAEMGLGPQREPRLHFEIRRNGKPVDPLKSLSPRSE